MVRFLVLGVEIGGKATIEVGLHKKISIGFPVTETSDSWYTHGSTANSIDDALKIACEEAAKLIG
jgi:amidase